MNKILKGFLKGLLPAFIMFFMYGGDTYAQVGNVTNGHLCVWVGNSGGGTLGMGDGGVVPAVTTTASNIASGSAVSLTTATPANVTTLPLAAGTWLVYGNVNFTNSATVLTNAAAGISTTTATLPNASLQAGLTVVTATTSQFAGAVVGQIIISTGTTTAYLVASDTFASGTATASGQLTAIQLK